MRHTILASAFVGTLLLGGCQQHRQTHVFVPGVEAREWWYPSTSRSLNDINQRDEVGRVAFVEPEQQAWRGGSSLSASDALGGASFYDTVAYVEARRLEKLDAVATAPAD